MTLITVKQVEAELGVAFDKDDASWLSEQKIPMAQAEIESILGRPVEPRTIVGERHLLQGFTGNTMLRLDASPVLTIDELRVEGTPADPLGYTAWPWGVEFIVLEAVLIPTAVEIDYHAGFLPGDSQASLACASVLLARVCRDVLQRARRTSQDVEGMAGLKSISVEGSSYVWQDEFGTFNGMKTGFLDEELKAISRYRRRVIR